MQKHPSINDILRYCLGRKDSRIAPKTAAHLASGCAECARTVQEFEAVLAALSSPPLTEAPRPILGRALAWLEQQESARTAMHHARAGQSANARSAARRAASHAAREVARRIGAAAEGAARVVEEIRAGLIFDTAAALHLPGVRGAASVAGRQLMFECPAGQLHVMVGPAEHGRFELHGQFVPAAGATAPEERQVHLTQRDRTVTRRLTRSGDFHLTGLTADPIRLRIEWGAMRISFDPIDLARDRDR